MDSTLLFSYKSFYDIIANPLSRSQVPLHSLGKKWDVRSVWLDGQEVKREATVPQFHAHLACTEQDHWATSGRQDRLGRE